MFYGSIIPASRMHASAYMYTASRGLLITVISALVGACVADERDPQIGESAAAVDVHVAAVQQSNTSIEKAGREAVRLYLELAARLEERGVTPEEMQDAIDADDEEAVREMFGFTPEEYADAHQRLLAIGEGAAETPGDTPGEMEQCNGTWAPCFVGFAWGARAFAASGWLSLAIYTVGALTCAGQACGWDGPGWSRK